MSRRLYMETTNSFREIKGQRPSAKFAHGRSFRWSYEITEFTVLSIQRKPQNTTYEEGAYLWQEIRDMAKPGALRRAVAGPAAPQRNSP